MKEIGIIISCKARGPIRGLMVESTADNGFKAICMDTASTLGRMDGGMMDNINMTKSTDRALIVGLMEECTKEAGSTENNMVKASTYCRMVCRRKEFGRMVRESSGYQALRI